ncbi:primosomal protein N' [Specibacter cremeus]|uniref:primosomal protein N' n=1 Tax=Specibacter cremeus TaxID=1629051 RepID=UPI000F782BF9|nr:primosomal protein N' [Specibacter cremeus]
MNGDERGSDPHGVQLTLLGGFPSRERVADPHSGVELAAELPVAQVVIDSPLPHLDRVFDYSVPRELDDVTRPGVRVHVSFSGQSLNGFVISRSAASESERLVPLTRVMSAVPVLAPRVLELARQVAARYGGTVADVLRVAVPPRVAKLDKEYLLEHVARHEHPHEPGDAHPGPSLFAGYDNGDAFLTHLAAGGAPRAVLGALQGYGPDGWTRQLAQAVAHCHLSGRGAVVVVPDVRDLVRLHRAMEEVLPPGAFVRLTADDGPSLRYESFLRVLSGEARVVIGTRSAAYAPVADLGLVCCWDGADEQHIERRAPYQHTRDVLLLRAELEGAAVLLAGHSRSTEDQRLLGSGWAQPIVAGRALARTVTARVVSTADSFETDLDPTASLARLPRRAWLTAKDALARGPVLVQVARAGYAPALACQRCREIARCRKCAGPLMESRAAGAAGTLVGCRWCGTVETAFGCPTCGFHGLRAVAVGAARTAEELGRAFPATTVISSAGDHVKPDVPDRPAIVVATVGAEPVAPSGYAAALLLDGDTLLRRESLRAGEETLRRWCNAAALVRPAGDGGIVVVTADESPEVQALVRWDPPGYAERELGLRRELGLPPAVRIASLTGAEADVAAFTAALALPDAVRVVGPTALGPAAGPPAGAVVDAPPYRTLLFFPYALAAGVTARLRAQRAASAAKRVGAPVQVRCDGVDVV